MTDDRRLVVWVGVSIDGYTSGPGGPAQDGWLHEHARRPQSLAYFEGIWRGADTALLGRVNYEGFYSVRPGITRDPATDPRTRDLGRWLDAVEKVVISRTLQDASWSNSRIARDLADEVKALKAAPGRDILGLRLFPEGLPQSDWTMAETTVLADGAVGLHYRRSH